MNGTNRTRRSISLLAICTVTLQLGGLAAVANAHLGPSDRPPAGVDPPAPAVPSEAVADEMAAAAAEPPTPVVTTAVPVPTTAAPLPAPAPAPPVVAAPPPPAPPPAPAPAAPSAEQRVRSVFEASVPAAWRSAIPVRLEVIPGGTSWGMPDGTIKISQSHASGTDSRLAATLAHEFGHLIAFRYGSRVYNGAAPAGWPAYGAHPEEAWADCVSQAFTGVIYPSHGLPPCSGTSLSWTQAWLAQGPAAHQRTGAG